MQASEFVVLYQESGKGSLSLLCPAFKVEYTNESNTFACSTNFGDEFCGKTLTITIEIWLVTGRFRQSSTEVLIQCQEDNSDYTSEDVDEVDEENDKGHAN